MRLAPQIELTQAQREQLETLSRGRSFPSRLVERAKIISLAFEGKQNREIAQALGVTRRTVGRWRSRFAVKGLSGIEKDAPRPGRLASLPEQFVQEVVRKTTQEKPAKATHWSTRSMAKAVGVSQHDQPDLEAPWFEAAPDSDLQAQQRSALREQDRRRHRVVYEPSGARGGVVSR
jgi:transposase